MTCQHCGTVIAEKALICYKCGRSTSDPSSGARSWRTVAPRPGWLAALGLVVLAAAGLFMAQAAAGQAPRWLSWSIAGLAAVVLVWRLLRRRKG